MSLYFGIHPHRTEVPQSIIDLTPQIERVLLENNWVRQGELIVVVGGTKLGEPGRSNAIVLHRIGGY
jgi:pyruvate kinase